MVLEPGLFWQGFFNAQIGYQTSGLACIKGNPHQQPRKARTDALHLLSNGLLDDGLQEHCVLDMELLTNCFFKEGGTGRRDTQPLLRCDTR